MENESQVEKINTLQNVNARLRAEIKHLHAVQPKTPTNKHYDEIIAELKAENERLRALQPKALAGKLTDTAIAKLRKRGQYSDGGRSGLYIQVQTDGSSKRSWIFRYRDPVTGKLRSIGLGPYPTVSIDRAREKARQHRLQLLDNQDPRKERDAAKLDIMIAKGLIKTFREVAIKWYEDHISRKANKYADKIQNQLNRYVYPRFGDMPIEKIDTNTILNAVPGPRARDEKRRVGKRDQHYDMPLHDMWDVVHPTANDVLQYLDRIFDYATVAGFFHGANPAEKARKLLPAKEDVYQRESRRGVPYKQAHRFVRLLQDCQDRSVRQIGRPMLSFANEYAFWNACRIGEATAAQWKEIDRENKVWNVPWQHRKYGKRKRDTVPVLHRPLTPSMLAILDEMEKRRLDPSDDEALIFPSDRTGRGIKNVGTASRFVNEMLKEAGWKIKIHPHGCRSTLLDWTRARWKPGEAPFLEVLWEIQVDHKFGDKGTGAYGHDQQLDQRRRMMELYDRDISTASEPKFGKVLKLIERRTA